MNAITIPAPLFGEGTLGYYKAGETTKVGYQRMSTNHFNGEYDEQIDISIDYVVNKDGSASVHRIEANQDTGEIVNTEMVYLVETWMPKSMAGLSFGSRGGCMIVAI